MAGSRTWRTYTTDDNISYSIQVDKSNANGAISGGSGTNVLCLPRTANLPQPPKGFRYRYALAYNQANPKERRKFVIGNTSLIVSIVTPGCIILAEDYPGGGDTAGNNVNWVVTFYSGEKRRLVPVFAAPDTDLNDGTTPQ